MGKDNGGAGFIGNGILGGVDFLRENLGHPSNLGQKAEELGRAYRDNSMVAINEIKNRALESYKNNFDTSTQEIPVSVAKKVVGTTSNGGLGLTNYKDFVATGTPVGFGYNNQNLVKVIPDNYSEAKKVITESSNNGIVNSNPQTIIDNNSVVLNPGNNSFLPAENELGLYDRARQYLDGLSDEQKMIAGIGTAGIGAIGAGLYLGNKTKQNDGGNLKMSNVNYGRVKQAAALGNREAIEYVTQVEGTGIDFLVKQAALGNVEASNILDGIEIAFGKGAVKQAHLDELGLTKEALANEVISGAKDLYNNAVNAYGRGIDFMRNPIDNTGKAISEMYGNARDFVTGIPDAVGDGYRHFGNGIHVIAGDLKDEYNDAMAGGQNVYMDRIGDAFRHSGDYITRGYGDVKDMAGDLYNAHPAMVGAGAAALGAGALGAGAYGLMRNKKANFAGDYGYDPNGMESYRMQPAGAIAGAGGLNYDIGYDPNGMESYGMQPAGAAAMSDLGTEGVAASHPGYMDKAMAAIQNHPYMAATAAALGAGALGYRAYRAARPKTASFTNNEVKALEYAAALIAKEEQMKTARLAQDPRVIELAGAILRGEIK